MADEENKGYRVEDKRFIFRDKEEAKEEAEEKPAPGAEGKAEPGAAPRPERIPLPQMTFATFVFSLNSSALIHLGEYPDPATGKTECDLELAKQTVDLLGLLKEKTRGNLTPEEEQLLDAVLFDLRMRYVKLKG